MPSASEASERLRLSCLDNRENGGFPHFFGVLEAFWERPVEARILWVKFWNFGFRQPTVQASLCISFRVFLKFLRKKIIKSKPWILKNLKFSQNLKLKQNTDSATGNWVEMKSLPPQTIVHWPDPTPLPPPHAPYWGGINIKNEGDQEFLNLVSMICMNVQS